VATTDAGFPLAGAGECSTSFSRRFWAWCVDTPIRFAIGLAVVFLPMRFIVSGQAEKYGSTDPNYLWRVMSSPERAIVSVLWLLAAVIIPWLYTAVQECSASQATLGKRLLTLKVTDLEGRRISFARASGRFFASLIPSFGIGYCMALFTRRKQALHDIIAGCFVIRPAVKNAPPLAE
jgi:uncharacterized RDD family membrane protein YckC